MKVTFDRNRLLIEPETDFETDWLSQFIPPYAKGVAWLKGGLTPADIAGIIVESAGGE